MQDTTDYSDTAVTELINEANAIAETALTAARKALAEYGDPRLADTYATATLRAVGGYFGPVIDRAKFAKDGDGTVPAELTAASGLAYWAQNAVAPTSTLRRRIAKGTADLTPGKQGQHEGDVRQLAAHLKQARKALAEYQTLAPSNTKNLDLTATYTVTYPGDTEATIITPAVRTKTRSDGVTLTIIKGLAPLLADHINAIADEGDRLHALTVLSGAGIWISDTPEDDRPENGESSGSFWRDRGTLSTTYYGARGLPVSVVLDLAEKLRAQFLDELGEPERNAQQANIDAERDVRVTAIQDGLDNENVEQRNRWVWLIADFGPFPDAPNATVTDDPEVGPTRDAARNAAIHVLSTLQSAADPNSPASAAIRAWQEDPSLSHVWIHRTVVMAVFPYGGEHGSLEQAAQSIMRKLGKEYAPRYAHDALVVEGQPLTPAEERWRRSIEANDAQQ